MGIIGQSDFGAGMYRGREAPANSAYDLSNILIDDEGQPYRRGGSEYRSTANHGATLLGLADAYVYAGRRTLSWGATGPDFYVLDGSNVPQVVPRYSTGTGIPADFPLAPLTRTVTVGGYLMIPALYGSGASGVGATFLYAGSLKTAGTTVTTALVTTAGSRVVTATGTSWLTTLDRGMILSFSSGSGDVRIVDTVNSNTSITMNEPMTVTLAAGSGSFFPKMPVEASGLNRPQLAAARTYVASVAGRPIIALNNRIAFGEASPPFDKTGAVFPMLSGGASNYHELPADATIFGIDGIRDTVIVFTSTGVWAITNMLYDPLDDVGNIQQQVQQVNKDLVLWGDSGIAAYRSALVVPGIQDVVLLNEAGETEIVSEAIRPLYRSYVKAGYQPGTASVHRGHYHLPIVDQSNILIDYLVCRLDRGYAWTRWSGHATGIATASRVTDPARSPLLFGLKSQRITDLSDTMDPAATNASEADGSNHTATIDTHDYPTPGGRRGSTTTKIRVRYEATGTSPAVSAYWARGPEDATYTALPAPIVGGAATSDGLDEVVWPIGKQSYAIRFRITCASVTTTFKLREIEVHTRERGL